jgi:hypothetical protein
LFQFEQALGSLPDSKLPVANQLEQAITTIKSNVKVILDIQGENKVLKKVGLEHYSSISSPAPPPPFQ